MLNGIPKSGMSSFSCLHVADVNVNDDKILSTFLASSMASLKRSLTATLEKKEDRFVKRYEEEIIDWI